MCVCEDISREGHPAWTWEAAFLGVGVPSKGKGENQLSTCIHLANAIHLTRWAVSLPTREPSIALPAALSKTWGKQLMQTALRRPALPADPPRGKKGTAKLPYACSVSGWAQESVLFTLEREPGRGCGSPSPAGCLPPAEPRSAGLSRITTGGRKSQRQRSGEGQQTLESYAADTLGETLAGHPLPCPHPRL